MINTKERSKKSLEGRKFRFVVSSADEAAQIIRDRLGDRARVLSVKQVNGKGLSKFLSSPQLEIIVTVPKQEELVDPMSNSVADEEDTNTGVISEIEEKEGDIEFESSTKEFERDSLLDVEQKEDDQSSVMRIHQSLNDLLSKAGFDESVVNLIAANADIDRISDMPISQGLSEFSIMLRKQVTHLDSVPLTTRIAFFGAPGVGTTTALCKQLASEVFIRKAKVRVLKLENENPNPDDSLRTFCDILGIPLLKEFSEINDIQDDETLYIDVSGATLSSYNDWEKINRKLDALKINTRIQVLNAAYDQSLIKQSMIIGDKISATHMVFSHMDEINSATKLWPIVLKGGRPTLFLSCGQDITGDLKADVADYLIQKSFPSFIVN